MCDGNDSVYENEEQPAGCFNINTYLLTRKGIPIEEDTILRSSYVHNEISYASKIS